MSENIVKGVARGSENIVKGVARGSENIIKGVARGSENILSSVTNDSLNIFKVIVDESEQILNRGLDNIYINTALKIFIALYAAFAAPKLPQSLVNLFDNIFVRIFFAFSIVFMATRDPGLAILISIAFIVTLQTANKMRLYNTNLSVSGPSPNTSWLPSAKDKNYLNQTGDYSPENISVKKSLGNTIDNTIDLVEDTIEYGINSAENIVKSGVNMVDNIFDKDQETYETLNNVEMNNISNVQTNIIQDSDQHSCVNIQPNMHCIQGLESNIPSGYDN